MLLLLLLLAAGICSDLREWEFHPFIHSFAAKEGRKEGQDLTYGSGLKAGFFFCNTVLEPCPEIVFDVRDGVVFGLV